MAVVSCRKVISWTFPIRRIPYEADATPMNSSLVIQQTEMTIRAELPPLYTGHPCPPGAIRRDLYLASIGHVARKRVRVRARFDFPAIGLIVRGHGTYRVGQGPVCAV